MLVPVQLAQQRVEHLQLAAVPLDESLVREEEALPRQHRLHQRGAPLRQARHQPEARPGGGGLARVVPRAQSQRRRARLADLRREGLEVGLHAFVAPLEAQAEAVHRRGHLERRHLRRAIGVQPRRRELNVHRAAHAVRVYGHARAPLLVDEGHVRAHALAPRQPALLLR